MKRIAGLLAAFCITTMVSVANGQLRVEPSDDNVVANHIEGEWVLNSTLTMSLGRFSHQDEGFSCKFSRDEDVLGNIPESLSDDWIARGWRIYLAGYVTIKMDSAEPKTLPFLLTEINGNPVVYVLRPGDTKLEGAELAPVMLAPGSEKTGDLLFFVDKTRGSTALERRGE